MQQSLIPKEYIKFFENSKYEGFIMSDFESSIKSENDRVGLMIIAHVAGFNREKFRKAVTKSGLSYKIPDAGIALGPKTVTPSRCAMLVPSQQFKMWNLFEHNREFSSNFCSGQPIITSGLRISGLSEAASKMLKLYAIWRSVKTMDTDKTVKANAVTSAFTYLGYAKIDMEDDTVRDELNTTANYFNKEACVEWIRSYDPDLEDMADILNSF